jgi:endopeptidase La
MGLISSRMPEKKLKTWFDALMTIPFGKYKGINFKDVKPKKVKHFLDDLQKTMDESVHGHNDAKRQIIQMMAQQIKNPDCKGSMLGLWGVPGNGKTSLIKDGIAKALDKPFIFISLGGATDSSFLEGHSFTYEGSICGRIVDGLINSQCMDPIIYFDELDKISKTPKGDEITNILIHLTDPVQNSHFRDKYFYGIDIDLSKATMIFSFNDPSYVNHVLLDRITTIETKYLIISQKLYIAHNHLLPNIIKDMGMDNNDININDETIKYIIENWSHEGGVRKLKSLLYNIIREINIANLTRGMINEIEVSYPFQITNEIVKCIFKNKQVITPDKIHQTDSTGVINGLYASSDGSYGGIIPIQILWFPSTTPLEVKATGNLQHVIKESTQVATSLAFNKLDLELQEKYLLAWKDRPKGIHIHCPDGAIPKDGPSAGTALTVAIYSILTDRKIRHDIAITGEINLQGYVSAIGGLDNKLEGAKKAGVKLVLYPKENEKDVAQIKERNPTLIDDSLQIIAIESIDEALHHSLM